MKIKFLPLIFLLFVFSTATFAQSVIITPKKTVYTRKFLKPGEPKRNFRVVYPAIGGNLRAPLKSRLENTISYWRVFETSLKDHLLEEAWLTEAHYKINYNKNGILDISLTQEGVGAYPDSHTANLVIDLKTGEQVKLDDVFSRNLQDKLANLVDEKLQVEKNNIIRRINKGEFAEKGENADASKIFKEDVENLKFTAENFDEFSVSDKGVTILYDAGFPHVIQALQPDGQYFFTWAAIKPFIKRDGLLGKFVR